MKSIRLGKTIGNLVEFFEEDNYYEEDYEDIPEGCAACGGDYPNCKDGCPIFDE